MNLFPDSLRQALYQLRYIPRLQFVTYGSVALWPLFLISHTVGLLESLRHHSVFLLGISLESLLSLKEHVCA